MIDTAAIDTAAFERKFRNVDDLLLHLKGLVLVRALLEQRGASERELREHAEAIRSLRAQLVETLERGGGTERVAA